MELGGIVAAETARTLHTNIHTHGLQVDPRGNGDNPFLDLAPGEYFDYDIAIPADQPAGLKGPCTVANGPAFGSTSFKMPIPSSARKR